MTIGGDLLDVLPELRAEAESLMVDTCTITRADPDAEPNPVTGVADRVQVYPNPEWPDDHPWINGKCRVQALDPQERGGESGGYDWTTQRYRVDVPVGSYAPAEDDVVTINTATKDPHLTGRDYRVLALLHKSLATAYRLAVEDMLATQGA